MKCLACGQSAANSVATPDMESKIYFDRFGQEVGSCMWCHALIYKLNEDADWLHLATDRRGCGEEE